MFPGCPSVRPFYSRLPCGPNFLYDVALWAFTYLVGPQGSEIVQVELDLLKLNNSTSLTRFWTDISSCPSPSDGQVFTRLHWTHQFHKVVLYRKLGSQEWTVQMYGLDT